MPEVPHSSAYRNVATLVHVGVLERIAGAGDYGCFGFAEELAGHHHHPLCEICGRVEDLYPSPELERMLAAVARHAESERGYDVTRHRLELIGRCGDTECLRRREQATTRH